MTLIDRAGHFIISGRHTELVPLLADCVAAGSNEGMVAVKLLARDMYGGETFNWELKAPAAYCLLAWGQAGLRALVENALEEPTSKNFSLAFELLASTAEGYGPKSIRIWLNDNQLREAVSLAAGDWKNLASAARSRLHELVLSIEDDEDAALYAGTSMIGLAIQDPGATSNLIHALALRSVAVGPRVLAHYNELITGTGDNEAIFQRFFERHPLLLDPRALQVWSKPDFHGRWEPDFVVRTYDDRYIVVEIESPAKLLVTRRRELSAATTHAIGQVLDYRSYLLNHLTEASAIFPNFDSPAGLVVVGRECSLDDRQKAKLRSENESRPYISIVGFDTLASIAEANMNNAIHGIPGVIKGTRLL